MARLGAGLRVVVRPDDALDGVAEDEVGDLVAGEEVAGESAAVDGYDEDTLCLKSTGLAICMRDAGEGDQA